MREPSRQVCRPAQVGTGIQGLSRSWAALSGELRSLDGPAHGQIAHHRQTPLWGGPQGPTGAAPVPGTPDVGLHAPVPLASDAILAPDDLIVIEGSTEAAAATAHRTRALGAHVVVMPTKVPSGDPAS
jgi:hypothetical protein